MHAMQQLIVACMYVVGLVCVTIQSVFFLPPLVIGQRLDIRSLLNMTHGWRSCSSPPVCKRQILRQNPARNYRSRTTLQKSKNCVADICFDGDCGSVCAHHDSTAVFLPSLQGHDLRRRLIVGILTPSIAGP